MAVTAKIFLLFIGAVIVQSRHLNHFHRPHHHNNHNQHDVHGILDNIIHSGIFGGGLFGSNNMHGNGDGYVYPNDMGQEENHAPVDIGTGYDDNDQDLNIGANRPDQNNVMIGQPNESNPDDNLNIDVAKDPQIADDHNSNSYEPEAPTVTVEMKSDKEPETDNQGNQADNNQPHLNKATDNVAGQKINTGSGLNPDAGNVVLSDLNQQKNPEETNNDSINNKVPGFLDEDIKKGIVMVDLDSINHKVPGFNDEDIKKGIVIVNPDSINYKVLGLNDEDIKKCIVIVNPDSINYKVPGFNDEDIKKGVVMLGPDSIDHKIPGLNDAHIKNGILMVNPDSINYKVPGFNDEDVKKGMVMVGPDSIDHKVPGFNDEDIKKGIVMVGPDSFNHKVPGFIYGDTKKGIVMVGPDSIDRKVPGLNGEDIKNGILMVNPDSINYKVPGFNDEDVKKGMVMVGPDSIDHKVPGFNDEDIKKGIVVVGPDSFNHKVPGFNDEDIKEGIVMVNPDSISHKVPGLINKDIKEGIVMVSPDSINHKVPGFNDEEIKKGIVMVGPDSFNHKVPGFNDEDIKEGIVMVNPGSISHKVPGFINKDIKEGIVMVNPDSINHKVPGFIYGDMKKGILMVTDSNTHKVLGFLGKGEDEDIKNSILMEDPKLKYNINEGHNPIVPDMNVAKESISQNNPSITTENANDLIGYWKKDSGFIGNTVNMGTSTDEPKLSHNIFDESQFSKTLEPVHKETGPGFSDEEIKKGILMIDPEFKIIDTDKGLDKYSDEVVFPDKVAELKQNNQVNAQQNLPNKFSTGDNNNNQHPSVTPCPLTPTVQPTNNNIQGQWMTSDSILQTIPTSNNQGTLNQPSSFEFVQNPNQQVPLSNGNGYVHVVRNSNGDYTIINFPNNNGSPDQAVSGNSGINNPGQYYVLKNPGQTYVNTDSAYSGINNPSQIYVTGNSRITQPRQIYVTDGSGVSMPGQIYVTNNVPSSGRQAGNGGYYNVIQLNNGQTIYVPVNNDQNYGNGQNTQWNGQSNNGQIYYVPVDPNQGQSYQVLGNNPTGIVTLGSAGNQMNGGSTNNVPLLISYKDEEREKEGSEHSDSRRCETEE